MAVWERIKDPDFDEDDLEGLFEVENVPEPGQVDLAVFKRALVLATMRMSSKGRVVIPEAARKQMGLVPDCRFVVIGLPLGGSGPRTKS